MKINKLYLIIIFFITLFSSASAFPIQNTISSSTETEIKDLVGILAKLNTSSHIILSIDCSNSVNNTKEDAKKVALEFLNEIKKIDNDGKFKIGYVGWNDHLVSSSHFLYSNLDEIYNEIDDTINLTGFTCFGMGMNQSAKLLRAENTPGINNIIILISDGLQNCIRGSNFSCYGFKKNNSDINIYTIQIGEDPVGNKLLTCLENPISLEPKPPSNTLGKSNINTSPLIILTEMPFQIKTREIIRRDLNNMTVSKSVTGGNHGPRISLKLNAPRN